MLLGLELFLLFPEGSGGGPSQHRSLHLGRQGGLSLTLKTSVTPTRWLFSLISDLSVIQSFPRFVPSHCSPMQTKPREITSRNPSSLMGQGGWGRES